MFSKGQEELKIAALKTSGAFDTFPPGFEDFLISLGANAEDLANALNLVPSAVQLAKEQLVEFNEDLVAAQTILNTLKEEDDPAGFKAKQELIASLKAQITELTNKIKVLEEKIPTLNELMQTFADVQVNETLAEINKEARLMQDVLGMLNNGFTGTVEEAESVVAKLDEMGLSLSDATPKIMAEVAAWIRLQRELGEADDKISRVADAQSTLKDVSTDLATELRIVKGFTGQYSAETLRLAVSLGLTNEEIEKFQERLELIDKRFKELEGLEELQGDLLQIRSVFENTFDDILDSAMDGKLDMIEIFTSMVDELIKEIVRLSVIRPFLDSMFPDGKGGGGGIFGKLAQAIGLGVTIAGLGGGGGGEIPHFEPDLDVIPGPTVNSGYITSLGEAPPTRNVTNNTGSHTTIIIDARNSMGEEAIGTSIEAAMVRAMPQMVNASTNNVIIQRRRDPHLFEN
jgi:uncharacterized coiled-coil DUF342 family protein